MNPLWTAWAALAGTGAVLLLVQALARRRVLRGRPPGASAPLPPVSVLKPLCGADAGLEENLRSIFRQDYPDYEVVLGAADPRDPALDIARRVAAEFPGVRATILADRDAVGPNPKVANLANLLRRARHWLLLVSDSNVRVRPDHLRILAAHRARAGAGLVWSLFRATGASGLGGALESLQLNGYVSGGVSALAALGRACCVGKAMLLDRGDLERVGGFSFLSRFLAEDQVCAEELAAKGRPVVLSGDVIDNVLGRRSLRDFAARHLRWAKIRRCVSLPGYLGEALLNPVFLGAAGALAFRTPASAAVAAGLLALQSAADLAAERALGVRRPLWQYPFLELALAALRGVLWFLPLLSRSLAWRGHEIEIGPRSRILPRDRSGAETRPHQVPA
jgi:ceramide glucosyltransferase